MRTKIPYLSALLAGGLLAALAGCNGSSSGGTLSLGITDTPVEGVSGVVVAFTGVDLMGPNGQQSFTFPSEKTVDLLTLQGNASASLLSGVSVPAGNYQWIRLDVDAAHSYVMTSTGGQYALSIPSGSQTGLKLVSGFTVAQGNLSDFIIDFNLRQGLTLSNSGGTSTYVLTPAMRLTNNQQVGTISGTVAATLSIGGTLITASTCNPAVYVYDGTVATLNGYDVTSSGGTSPLTSANVTLDNTTGSYTYTVGFLAPGTYTLAVTCASADTSGATSLAFSTSQTASVTANTTTTVNF